MKSVAHALLLIGTFCSLGGSLAFADSGLADSNLAGSGLIHCTTYSNGVTTRSAGADEALARTQTLYICKNDLRTDNRECDSNLACDNSSAPHPFVVCKTVSNDILFSKRDRDSSLGRLLVAEDCKKSNLTNNTECDANVSCDNSHENPFVTCSTVSNHLNFSKSERDEGVARLLVGQACKADNRTDNAECDGNIYCNNGSAMPFVTCSTFSNALNFAKSERDERLSRTLVTQACRADNRTNNSECDGNVACDNSSDARLVTCASASRGLRFSKTERSEALARQISTQACRADNRTNNSECDSNVTCHGSSTPDRHDGAETTQFRMSVDH